MKLQEIKTMETPDLNKLLAKKREELRAARFSVNQGQEKKVRDLRKLRKLIARIMTVLTEKDRNPVEPAATKGSGHFTGLSPEILAKGEADKNSEGGEKIDKPAEKKAVEPVVNTGRESADKKE